MESYSVVTLNKRNITDFAKERNELLKRAEVDWVFFVDSDEVLSKKLSEEVKSLDPSGYDAFYVKRDNYFLGRFAGSDNIIRLGKRNAGSWQRIVHEIWKIDGPVGQLKNPLIHNTADRVSVMVDKINRYSTMHGEANLHEGKRSNLLKIIIMPKMKFIQSWLTGKGLVLSILMSFHSFLSWAKEWEIQGK